MFSEEIKDSRVQGCIDAHNWTWIEFSCSLVQIPNSRARLECPYPILSSWTTRTVSDAFLCSQEPTHVRDCRLNLTAKAGPWPLGFLPLGVSALFSSLQPPWLKDCHNSCCVYYPGPRSPEYWWLIAHNWDSPRNKQSTSIKVLPLPHWHPLVQVTELLFCFLSQAGLSSPGLQKHHLKSLLSVFNLHSILLWLRHKVGPLASLMVGERQVCHTDRAWVWPSLKEG